RLEVDDAAYGRALSESLFGDAAVRECWTQARQQARELQVPLRVRLVIDPGAQELQRLWWETLCAPIDGSPLLRGEGLLFSRQLRNPNVRPRAEGDLRAVVLISNPDAVANPQGPAPLDVAAELARARASLGDIDVTALASGGQATLAGLMAHLRA